MIYNETEIVRIRYWAHERYGDNAMKVTSGSIVGPYYMNFNKKLRGRFPNSFVTETKQVDFDEKVPTLIQIELIGVRCIFCQSLSHNHVCELCEKYLKETEAAR